MQSKNSFFKISIICLCLENLFLSYTYISSQKRLVKLTNHDHIVDADWEQLCSALQKNSADYEGEIEDLFQAELYLISPLTEPVRFLEKEYFLTSQQRDIERQILKRVRAEKSGYFIFTGLQVQERRYYFMILQ